MFWFIILFSNGLLVFTETNKVTEDLLNSYKPLESFVALRGGDFHMGINDPDGTNNEFPMRYSNVKPFRYKNFYLVLLIKFK